VVVIDDDTSLGDNVKLLLELEGLKVQAATSGGSGLAAVRRMRPEVVVLDLLLPDMGGVEIVHKLRALGQPVAIIMASARGDLGDMVAALEAGADDYLVKPFHGRELVARVHVQQRRLRQSDAPSFADRLEYGDLVLDRARREASHGGAALDLTRTEFDLLWHLVAHQGRVLSRQQVIAEAWPPGRGAGPRSVDTHMAALRRKIRASGCGRNHVTTVPGVGYKLG
jgi:DNA-binding response OmpR family regulator